MPFPLLRKKQGEPCAEALEKAAHDAEFLLQDLQEALKTANPIASLLILQHIEKTAALKRDIEALRSALATQNG